VTLPVEEVSVLDTIRTSTEVIPAVANHQLRTDAGLSCALAVVGVVLILGSNRFRRPQDEPVVSAPAAANYRPCRSRTTSTARRARRRRF
jgi:hypothetical protein